MSASNEVRLYDNDKGLMLMVCKNNADFTTAQQVAIKAELEQMKGRVLGILKPAADPERSDNAVTEDRIWGHGP